MIELCVTIAILAILLAIGTMNYLTYKNNMTTRENAKTIDSVLHYAEQEGRNVIIPSVLTFNSGGTTSGTFSAAQTLDLRIDVCNGADTTPLRRVTLFGVAFKGNLNVITAADKAELGIHVDFFKNSDNTELGTIAVLNNGIPFSFAATGTGGQPVYPIQVLISRGSLGFEFGIDPATGAIKYTDFNGSI